MKFLKTPILKNIYERLLLFYAFILFVRLLFFVVIRIIKSVINNEKMDTGFTLDTGRKLNVHKTFRRLQDIFWTSYVCSIYVLCPEGTWSDISQICFFWLLLSLMKKNVLWKIRNLAGFKEIGIPWKGVLPIISCIIKVNLEKDC